MNANTTRLVLAILGGLAGVSLAIALAPGTRKGREQLGRAAGEMGESLRQGLRTRLRSTPLMEAGQDVARAVAERAREAAHRAQETVSRVRELAEGGSRSADRTTSEALEQASEAARRALDAVEELVKRTEDVIQGARKKIG